MLDSDYRFRPRVLIARVRPAGRLVRRQKGFAPKMKQPPGRYYSNEHGHYVRAENGHYKMPLDWIDTDNQVWAEPRHLYTHPEKESRGSVSPAAAKKDLPQK